MIKSTCVHNSPRPLAFFAAEEATRQAGSTLPSQLQFESPEAGTHGRGAVSGHLNGGCSDKPDLACTASRLLDDEETPGLWDGWGLKLSILNGVHRCVASIASDHNVLRVDGEGRVPSHRHIGGGEINRGILKKQQFILQGGSQRKKSQVCTK